MNFVFTKLIILRKVLVILFLSMIFPTKAFSHSTSINEYNNAPSIHQASARGDFARVKQLVSKKRKLVKLRMDNGRTPLHPAAESGHLEIVRFLIENGAKADAKDNDDKTPLHLAANKGNDKIVVFLVLNGADVNSRTTYNMTPLHYACTSENSQVISYLIDHGADMYVFNNNGSLPIHMSYYDPYAASVILSKGFQTEYRLGITQETAIHQTAAYYSDSFLRAMINYGADINAYDRFGDSPLKEAISTDNYENIKLLVYAGADVNQDYGELSAFEYAARYGKTVVFRFLRENGGDFHNNENRKSLLHYAAEGGNIEIIKACLDKGLNPNKKDNSGRIPLHYIAANSDLATVKMFVSLGADINLKDNFGDTPLHLAVRNQKNSYRITEYLINKGAKVDAENNYLQTPLMNISFSNSNYKKILKLLIEKGADVNKRSRNGNCIQHLAVCSGDLATLKYVFATGRPFDPQKDSDFIDSACINGSLNIVKYLHNLGADLITRRGEYAPIHYACQNTSSSNVVTYLLDNGVDVNERTLDNRTALFIVSYPGGDFSVPEILVKRGIDINARDDDGNTAIHIYVNNKDEEMLEFLLKKRANPNIKNNLGKTPLQLAFEKNQREEAKTLISNWADVDPYTLSKLAKDKDRRMFNYVINHSMSLWIKVILPVFLLIIIIVTRILKRNKRPVQKV